MAIVYRLVQYLMNFPALGRDMRRRHLAISVRIDRFLFFLFLIFFLFLKISPRLA